MIKQTATVSVLALLFAAPLGGTVFAQNNDGFFGQVSVNGYGGGKVEVCRETGSRFNPYVKVSVPAFVADRWIEADRAILPDAQGKCPNGISVRDFVQQILAGIFNRRG